MASVLIDIGCLGSDKILCASLFPMTAQFWHLCGSFCFFGWLYYLIHLKHPLWLSEFTAPAVLYNNDRLTAFDPGQPG